MSNLSKGAVLIRTRQAKKALQEGKFQIADDILNDMIREISGSEFICAHCGCGMTQNDYHIGGERCADCI